MDLHSNTHWPLYRFKSGQVRVVTSSRKWSSSYQVFSSTQWMHLRSEINWIKHHPKILLRPFYTSHIYKPIYCIYKTLKNLFECSPIVRHASFSLMIFSPLFLIQVCQEIRRFITAHSLLLYHTLIHNPCAISYPREYIFWPGNLLLHTGQQHQDDYKNFKICCIQMDFYTYQKFREFSLVLNRRQLTYSVRCTITS